MSGVVRKLCNGTDTKSWPKWLDDGRICWNFNATVARIMRFDLYLNSFRIMTVIVIVLLLIVNPQSSTTVQSSNAALYSSVLNHFPN